MEKSKKKSKQSKILAHLVSGKSITPIQALELYGSFRLGALIFNLRAEGHNIKTDIMPETRHAKYSYVTDWEYESLRLEVEAERYFVERTHELQERYSRLAWQVPNAKTRVLREPITGPPGATAYK